jgi:hypothetical protein
MVKEGYPPSLPPCRICRIWGDNPQNNVYGLKNIYVKIFGNIPIYEKKFWGKKVSDPYISENVKKNLEKILKKWIF